MEGDDPGAPTSYGIGGWRSSKSVVDYFLLPAALLPQVESLRVEDLAVPLVGDHAALVLRLGPPTRARPRQPRQRRQAARQRRHRWHACSQQQRQGQRRPPPPPTDPRWMRFRPDNRRGAVAATAIQADPRLAQLTALACKAQSAADLDAIGLQRAALIVEHCEIAGLRRVLV